MRTRRRFLAEFKSKDVAEADRGRTVAAAKAGAAKAAAAGPRPAAALACGNPAAARRRGVQHAPVPAARTGPRATQAAVYLLQPRAWRVIFIRSAVA